MFIQINTQSLCSIYTSYHLKYIVPHNTTYHAYSLSLNMLSSSLAVTQYTMLLSYSHSCAVTHTRIELCSHRSSNTSDNQEQSRDRGQKEVEVEVTVTSKIHLIDLAGSEMVCISTELVLS